MSPRRPKTTPDELRRALKDQPLVSLKGACAILGYKPQNMGRLRDRMPESIPAEGSERARLYVRSEIVELARQLAREAKAKKRKAERNTA